MYNIYMYTRPDSGFGVLECGLEGCCGPPYQVTARPGVVCRGVGLKAFKGPVCPPHLVLYTAALGSSGTRFLQGYLAHKK